tara:strand:- start:672 stop:968 length:297 start_codon:yes stop_codon:yes gene_type:complete
MTYQINHMRLTGQNKYYWQNQLKEFASRFAGHQWGKNSKTNIIKVQFGKQDTRGGFSICLVDDKHCIPRQKTFETKQALLGFIQGWNMCDNNNINNFY